MRVKSACVGVACAAGLAATASASSIPFFVYQSNNHDVSGLSLSVNVVQDGGQVHFIFNNTSLAPNDGSSLTRIYFEQSARLGNIDPEIDSIVAESAGVSYKVDASPSDPKGGINWAPGSTQRSFQPKPQGGGLEPNGVGVGESLTLAFNLLGGSTANDVKDDLLNSVFRIAVHVQSIGSDGSGSIWASTGEVVIIPLPGAAGLGALGLGLVAIRRRR